MSKAPTKRGRDQIRDDPKAAPSRAGGLIEAGYSAIRQSAVESDGADRLALAKAADQSFERATRVEPDAAGPHTGRGFALCHQSRFEEALDEFNQALALRPKLSSAMFGRGEALVGLGNYSAALVCYKDSLEAAAGEAHLDQGQVVQTVILSVLNVLDRLTGNPAAIVAKDQPTSHWVDARKRGVEVPDFIKEAFADELADGSMHKGLFSRYEHLRRDFYAYKRHHDLPGWLEAMPTESEWNERQVAAGKVSPAPPRTIRTDATRAYERGLKRAARSKRELV